MGFIDLLRYASLVVAGIAGAMFLFFKYFLGQDMTASGATYKTVWVVCGIAWVMVALLKYTGKVGMRVSRKKCVKCTKLATMGSIYCDFHQKQANREIAFQGGVGETPSVDDDQKLGY